ncbi:hypothetical protein CCACVL1_23042, partial [Corchorus capsularis]
MDVRVRLAVTGPTLLTVRANPTPSW